MSKTITIDGIKYVKQDEVTKTDYAIDYKGCAVLVAYDKQSPDIAQGVERAFQDSGMLTPEQQAAENIRGRNEADAAMKQWDQEQRERAQGRADARSSYGQGFKEGLSGKR